MRLLVGILGLAVLLGVTAAMFILAAGWTIVI